MKANVLKVVVLIAVLLAAVGGGYELGKHVHGVTPGPAPITNNTLRWVRDPNLGTLYYGWYENDGSSFNYVATASRNHRMGDVQETNVPAHRWVQVD